MHETDSTDGARLVNPEFEPLPDLTVGPVMRRGEVLSTKLLKRKGFDNRRIAAWKKQGLKPLNWGTSEEHFLSDHIIDLPAEELPKGRKPK